VTQSFVGLQGNSSQNPLGVFRGIVTQQNVAHVQQMCSPQNISHMANIFSENLRTTLKNMSQTRQKTPQNNPSFSLPKNDTPPSQQPTEAIPQNIPIVSPQTQKVTTQVETSPQNIPPIVPQKTTEPEVITNNTVIEESEEQSLRNNLAILYEIGFINTHLNEEILRRFDGNLEHTIQFLIDLEE